MEITFSISWALIIGMLVSTVLPIVVGLVTRTVTNGGIKAVILAALAAVTGLLTELLNAINAGVPYDIGVGLLLVLTSFLVAVGMHFGLWKPTAVSHKAQMAFTN